VLQKQMMKSDKDRERSFTEEKRPPSVVINSRHIIFGRTVKLCMKFTNAFYARKQLLLSARLIHRNSVCLSVCLSHG